MIVQSRSQQDRTEIGAGARARIGVAPMRVRVDIDKSFFTLSSSPLLPSPPFILHALSPVWLPPTHICTITLSVSVSVSVCSKDSVLYIYIVFLLYCNALCFYTQTMAIFRILADTRNLSFSLYSSRLSLPSFLSFWLYDIDFILFNFIFALCKWETLPHHTPQHTPHNTQHHTHRTTPHTPHNTAQHTPHHTTPHNTPHNTTLISHTIPYHTRNTLPHPFSCSFIPNSALDFFHFHGSFLYHIITLHYSSYCYCYSYSYCCPALLSIALGCTTLRCTALYCTALHCTGLPCPVLPYTGLYYTILPCTAVITSNLYSTAFRFSFCATQSSRTHGICDPGSLSINLRYRKLMKIMIVNAIEQSTKLILSLSVS